MLEAHHAGLSGAAERGRGACEGSEADPMMRRSRFETQVPNLNQRSRGDRDYPADDRRDATGDERQMRIASWSWGGRLHVGTISADGREAHAPGRRRRDARRAAADRGAGARRAAAARRPGRGSPVEAIALRAPLPRPLREPLLRRPQLPRPRRRARRAASFAPACRPSTPGRSSSPSSPNAWSARTTRCACRARRSAARSTTRASSRS